MKKVLVTGGTGFLGLRLVGELLKRDYDVKTTIRKDSGKDRIIKVLNDQGIRDLDHLSFIKADLSSDDNWDLAMQDRDYVFSVASPVFFKKPKNEQAAIRPAVDGIMRILKAAQRNNVKRVVMTSNFGAIGFSKFSGITTERDWTNENQKGLSIYEKSKLIAEKEAWKYVHQSTTSFEFATVNPVAIFGPALDVHVSGSFDLLKDLLNGKTKRIPQINLNVVDVRDVVEIHIKAMETPAANGQRFIASANGAISLPEIAKLIQNKRPELAQRVSDKVLSNWLLNLVSMVNSTAKEGKLLKDINRNVSNQKAKDILNWQPRSTNETAVLTAVDSLIKYDENSYQK